MDCEVEGWIMVRRVERELLDLRAQRLSRIGPMPSVRRHPLGWVTRLWRRMVRPIAASERRAWDRAGAQQEEPEMKWVTRERPMVDRIACPWLIKRFVDPEAEFLYVPADEVMATAAREGATPYDVPGVELGHHGTECSFDAIVKKYDLDDPALHSLALIVRGADTDARDLTPESAGLYAIAGGFRMVYADDREQLEREMPVYDALYAYCQSRVTAA